MNALPFWRPRAPIQPSRPFLEKLPGKRYRTNDPLIVYADIAPTMRQVLMQMARSGSSIAWPQNTLIGSWRPPGCRDRGMEPPLTASSFPLVYARTFDLISGRIASKFRGTRFRVRLSIGSAQASIANGVGRPDRYASLAFQRPSRCAEHSARCEQGQRKGQFPPCNRVDAAVRQAPSEPSCADASGGPWPLGSTMCIDSRLGGTMARCWLGSWSDRAALVVPLRSAAAAEPTRPGCSTAQH